jgi:protoporphyrinogen oxidase
MFSQKKEGQSVQSFYSKVLGKKNYARLFSRLFSAVIVQPADEYAADLFLKRRNTRRKDFPKSFTFSHGMQQLLDAIVENDNIEVRTQTKVKNLVRKESGYQVETSNGECFGAKNVALATGPKLGAELIREAHPELSSLLEGILVQKIHSRAVKLDKASVDLERLAFVIPVEGPCYSVVTRDVVDDPKARAFAFHFEQGVLEPEKQLKAMEKLLGTDQFNLDQTFEAYHRLPLLKPGHQHKVEQMDRLLEEENLYLTGNYFDGLSLEDCVARSRKESKRYLNK